MIPHSASEFSLQLSPIRYTLNANKPLVTQWTEYFRPKEGMQVRFLPRGPGFVSEEFLASVGVSACG